MLQGDFFYETNLVKNNNFKPVEVGSAVFKGVVSRVQQSNGRSG